MDGYNAIFKNSINNFNNLNDIDKLENLKFFRTGTASHIFSFIHNNDKPPNQDAINISKQIDDVLYDKYYKRCLEYPKIGYNFTPNNLFYDECDSHHIMMSIILFKNIKDTINTIVEIGAGYGGWLYLNLNIVSFNKWVMIDLPHLGSLQEFYLNHYNVPKERYEIVSAFNYNGLNKMNDLIIGAHSLSEFALDVFIEYFNHFIKYSKYLFYAYCKCVHLELNAKKLELIMQYFEIVIEIPSENNNVSNILFKNKTVFI